MPLPMAQTADELRHRLSNVDDPQTIADRWVEEQKKWPYREIWLLNVRAFRIKRRIRPVIIRPAV